MQTRFIARGLVYGKYWGGGEGAYPAEKYQADTLEELEKQIEKGVKDGSIDSGMGYEQVLGALMTIETIKTIEHDGEVFERSDFASNVYGNLTERQVAFLETGE